MGSISTAPFLLWTADRNRKELNRPTNHSHPDQDSSAKEARMIVFTPQTGAVPTPEQEEVRRRIDRVVGQLEWLYGDGGPDEEAKFREQYVEVFALARQALEIGNGSAAKANERLQAIEADLIEDEWRRLNDSRKRKIANVAADVKGPFLLWTAEATGRVLDRPSDGSHPPQDRHDDRARQILYSANPGVKPSSEEMRVCDRVDRILHALNHLYKPGDPASDVKFRAYYANLFGVARWALEAKEFDPPAAMKELDVIEKDLVEDEAPAVKTRRIKDQFIMAAAFSIPVLISYAILRQVSSGGELDLFLKRFGGDRLITANLMLLLFGSFVGVCLSYAYRKPEFASADDLVSADRDQLLPWLRLVLIAALSVLLVLFARVGVVNLTVGSFALATVLTAQTPAFVVGALCGIGEQLLPNTVMTTKFLGPRETT